MFYQAMFKILTFLVMSQTMMTKTCINGYPDVKNEKGILVFESEAHLQSVSDLLNYQLNQAIPPVLSITPRSDDPDENDEFAGQAEDNCFNPEQALIDFENKLNFLNSLRRILQDKEIAWLKSSLADNEKTDPSDHFIGDPVDRTFLNKYLEIKVGSSYFKETLEGTVKYKTRKELEAARKSVKTKSDNLTAHRLLQLAYCRTNVWNSGYRYCAKNKRRVKWVVGHHTFFFKFKAMARTRCYKKGFLGIWWWYWCFDYAQVSGAISQPLIIGCNVENNFCRTQFIFNTFSGSSNSGNGWWKTHKICVPTKTAPSWIWGRHYSSCCDSLGYFSEQLIW